jgi:gliding motility-associated transport system ATP-binding protein
VIRATDLHKAWATGTALERVSFEARPGEVLGFLGPNGAGKTTTMRILAGFLPPTGGQVEICGLPPRRARAKIGYLPENVPLYPEMRVEEYLRYRARLKGVRPDIDAALAQAGITDERRRIIGQLSKGYRQRVGLADALVHRPEVLILDEPTDGLDPNQRRVMLKLIGELGRERTVILSTHILSEVEAVCSRVVILDRGRVVAEGRVADLARPHLSILARGDRERLMAALQAIEGVVTVESEAEGELVRLRVTAASDVREAAAAAVVGAGHLRELADAGLAEVFARLTEKP